MDRTRESYLKQHGLVEPESEDFGDIYVGGRKIGWGYLPKVDRSERRVLQVPALDSRSIWFKDCQINDGPIEEYKFPADEKFDGDWWNEVVAREGLGDSSEGTGSAYPNGEIPYRYPGFESTPHPLVERFGLDYEHNIEYFRFLLNTQWYPITERTE